MDKDKLWSIYHSLSAEERIEMIRILEYDYLKVDINAMAERLPSGYGSAMKHYLISPSKGRIYQDIINRFYDDYDSDLSHWQNIEGAIMSFLDSRQIPKEQAAVIKATKTHNNEHER